MTDSTPTPALTPAAQNPWYLLATLYGEPVRWGDDEELQTKNRVAWNRYYASQWTDEQREALKGRVDTAELMPFSDAELSTIRQQFKTRAGNVQVEMPGAGQEIDFQECQFDEPVYCDGYVFESASFTNAIFNGNASFRRVTFTGDTDFRIATFTGNASFNSANFTGDAEFSSTKFTRNTYFSRATFTGDAEFSGVTFTGNASFTRTTFTWDAEFSSANFTRNTYFGRAAFTGHADFSNANFTGQASFTNAIFSGNANFGSASFRGGAIFTNSELKAPTDFEKCRFLGEPPRFHGAKLHEDTVWRGVTWPTAPSDPDKAAWFTDAYERLKQEMDRLKKHEDELMFFAKELACRRVARGQVRGLPIGAYGVLCHYGQSYMLPLGWLIALILVGAVQFWPVLNWDFLLALGVSTANTLGPLGLRKEMMDAGTLPPDLSRWLRFLSGAQMVIGLILLFLIGLGLRNRFRMK